MSWACGACGAGNVSGSRFCGQCGAPRRPDGEAGADTPTRLDIPVPRGREVAEASGRPSHERRLVTSLFADVSGFTTLAETLDAEALAGVIDPAIARISGIVHDYGGFVEKYAGDAVLALFGAPVAYGDDAERALFAALAIRRAVDLMTTEAGAESPLAVRIGVHTGYVIARLLGHLSRMDYGVVGESIVLAQRLEAAAGLGEIFVGGDTVQLAGDRFEFEVVGPVTVKGRTQPVEVHRLVRERVQRRVRHHATPFVGREPEVVALTKVVERARAGVGGMVAIIGEPGSGKSRLVDALQAVTQPAWLLLEGASLAQNVPYAAFLRAVSRLLANGLDGGIGSQTDAEEVEAALRTQGFMESAAHITTLMQLCDLPGDLEPLAFRRSFHDAFAADVANRAAPGCAIVVLDDVQWFDTSTTELVAELIDRTALHRVVLVATARPEARDALVSLGFDVLDLPRLDHLQVQELIEHAWPDATMAERLGVAYRCGGNPLFALELALAARSKETASPKVVIAPGVESLIAGRIDALPNEAREALDLLAVLEPDGTYELLNAALGGSGHRVLPVLIDASLIEIEKGRLAFRHPVAGEVAYGRLVTARRESLHRRVADVIETVDVPDAVQLLARHLDESGDHRRAVPALERAAVAAERVFANAEAEHWYERALEHAIAGGATAADLARLRTGLGSLLLRTGRHDDALEHFAQAAQVSVEPEALAGVARALSRAGRPSEAVAYAAESRTRVPAAAACLLLEEGRARLMLGDFARAEAAFAAGMALDPPRMLRANLLLSQALVMSETGDVKAGLALATEAADLAGDDLSVTATALRVKGQCQYATDDETGAVATLLYALAIAERVGDVKEIGACLMNLGGVYGATDEMDRAVDVLERACSELGRIGHPGRAQALESLGATLATLARYDDAEARLVEAEALARSLNEEPTIADVHRSRARLALARGDFAAAVEFSRAANRRYERLGMAGHAANARALLTEARRAMRSLN